MKKITKALSFVMIMTLCIFTLTACGGSGDANAGADTEKEAMTTLVFGTSADYAPFEFMYPDENGDMVYGGIDVEVAQYIADYMGVKLQTGELTHTFSAYQIKRPSYIGVAPGPLESGGEQRLRGLEWSVFGNITPELSLLGGVTHIKSEQRNTGKDTYGVPEWRARIGLDWRTPLKGLTVGGRVIYVGKQWSNSGNTLRVPSWNRLDLIASYATKFGNTPVCFNAAVENATDKKYWIGLFADGFVMPGAPRTFRLSATVSF